MATVYPAARSNFRSNPVRHIDDYSSAWCPTISKACTLDGEFCFDKLVARQTARYDTLSAVCGQLAMLLLNWCCMNPNYRISFVFLVAWQLLFCR